MNFQHYMAATSLEGSKQVIPQGPVAALEFIKNLGTNGGGFFNANGAHPYENPTPLTNLMEMLAIVLLPAALTNTFGRMIRQPRQGWLLYAVMVILFATGLISVHLFEQAGNPHLDGVDYHHSASQAGGNMEGKEVRFGIAGSTLTAVVTSNTATGSNNSMHDSYTSFGGAGSPHQSSARGTCLRGARHRYLQHGDGCCHSCVFGWAYGGPYPRVSWEEDRSGRKQVDHPLRAC
jgi:K+-transporting ATPase ATPase A chain